MPETKERLVVKIPLQIISVTMTIGIFVFLGFVLFGPFTLLSAYFERQAAVLRAEGVERSIRILGERNYFLEKGCNEFVERANREPSGQDGGEASSSSVGSEGDVERLHPEAP